MIDAVVLLPKPNRRVQFCLDLVVNMVTKFDTYPILCTHELPGWFCAAYFYSTLDPRGISWFLWFQYLEGNKAFSTPFGLHHYVTLLFKLFGSSTCNCTFYWLSSINHLPQWLAEALTRSQGCPEILETGRRLNPKKDSKPKEAKLKCGSYCSLPKTLGRVRQFLGLRVFVIFQTLSVCHIWSSGQSYVSGVSTRCGSRGCGQVSAMDVVSQHICVFIVLAKEWKISSSLSATACNLGLTMDNQLSFT